MKLLKVLPFIMGIISAIAPSAKADSQGHVLDGLWKQYESAGKSDLPVDQQQILRKIKDQASKERLSWDFYDALTNLESVGTRINWKKSDSLRTWVEKEIENYNEPVVTFFYKSSYWVGPGEEFLKANEEALKASHNPEFYKRDWTVTSRSYDKVLIESFENDRDYVLWNLFIISTANPDLAAFKGRYPLEQLVEFEQINRQYTRWGEKQQERKAALEAFTQKYSDRGVSLLSRQELLGDTFRKYEELNENGEKFSQLRAECVAFEKDRKASPEKTMASCCKQIEDLIQTLDAQQLSFHVKDDVLTVYVRNLSEVEVDIQKDKKSVHKESLKNLKNSYYAQDTIVYNTPKLDDGTYTVVCKGGKEKCDCEWEKYTISAVTKYDAGGWWAYAADYITGEPVKGYEKGFRKINAKSGEMFSVSIAEGGRVRRSREEKLYGGFGNSYKPEQQLQAIVLTDRAAFNPEETVQYKVILYRLDYSLAPVGEGQKVSVKLLDAKNEEVKIDNLVTGEFGSAAGSFFIPRGERNGRYTIRAEVEGKAVGSTSIRVDDFVLPTFAATFDNQKQITAGEKLVFSGAIKAYSGHSLSGADITYTLTRWGDAVSEGELKLQPGGRFELSHQTKEEEGYGSYILKITVVDGTGETQEFSRSAYVASKPRDEKPKEYFFEDKSDENRISLRAVAGDKPTWAVVDLYGVNKKLIESKIVRFEPGKGTKAEQTFAYDYKATYPEAIVLTVLYFQNSRSYQHTASVRRKDTRYDLPLEFTRFLDTTSPATAYEFIISTAKGVECAATIFDKSSETVQPNRWSVVRPVQAPVQAPYYDVRNGRNEGHVWFSLGRNYMMKSAAGAVMMMDMAAPEAMEEEAVAYNLESPEATQASSELDDEFDSVAVREDFSTTIAWEPFLRSDDKGNITFSFKNADKLSTFYVQLFAHDKAMKNATLRKEMLVTLPVKISVLEARYLYPEDRWNIRVTLSSNLARDIKGTLDVSGTKVEVEVPALAQTAFELPVSFSPKAKKIEFTAAFKPEDKDQAGDAVKMSIPILESSQTVSEAHSAVLLSGADKDALIASLREQFVNIPGSKAEVREISIKQMLYEALPEHFDTESENVISLIRTLYTSTLARKLGGKGLDESTEADVVQRILDCRKADGGFGWIKGFDSSPYVTAVVLDFCAGLRSRGLSVSPELAKALPGAVKYLDNNQFDKTEKRYWWFRLSREQYLYIRSMYPEVKFAQKTDSKWRKETRQYLVPSSDRGLQGNIYGKARRMMTLQALIASDKGLALARSMGVSLGAKSRLSRSLEADTRSLSQYAVRHGSGGIYYPNAVMPWRGLLESELYAHSLICDLLASRSQTPLAEGIRLWLMIQKETQQWKEDPATVNALASVSDASPETLATRVIALSGSVRLPFARIKAAGNGLAISREWFRLAPDGSRALLSEGSVLNVGDKVVSVCSIWNEENRSFIHISVPRPACLTPQNQLSGYFGWNAYRSVRIDKTEYWFESYPEEKTKLEETFYVTQSGVFHSGITEIESLYAPHYRANDAAGIEIITKSR